MNVIKYTFLFLLVSSVAFAQIKPGKIVFIPEKPTANSSLKIQYTLSDDVKSVSEVTAFVYVWSFRRDPFLVELPLKKVDDNSWSADVPVRLDTVVFITCKMIVDKNEDTNNDTWWGVHIFNSNNKPVEGALLAEVQSIAMHKNNFTVADVQKRAMNLLDEENAMYPSSPTWSMRWQLVAMRAGNSRQQEAQKAIEKDIDSLVKVITNEIDLLDYSAWYDRLNNPAKAEGVLDTLIHRYKNKSASARKELRPLRSLKDYDLIKTGLANIIKTYPGTPEAEGLKSSLVQIAFQQKNYEQAASYVKEYGLKNADMITAVARQILNDNGNASTALTLAKQSVEYAKQNQKPAYLPVKEWESTNNNLIAITLSTYGYALLKNDTYADAEKVFEESLQMNEKGDPELFFHYLECLKKQNKVKESIPVYEKMLSFYPSTDEIKDGYKIAYEQINGSLKGFDDRYKELTQKAFGAKFDELKKSVKNQSIKDFTLNELNGKSVSLESLRGKVVVLDFWATWCGPCKQSFPFLQKVFDKYKSSKDVVIYAANTFERVSGDSRKQSVEKFIKDNKYTFPVLMDNDVASSNGIQSIPTQLVIDKKGVVQFVNVGFEGPQMVEELSAKIDLLRSEDFYK